MSNDDSIETSLSTFAKEMSTMAMIMSSMKMIKESGRECLVIIDELGRGTSPSEGIGIAHALAEEIIKANVGAILCVTPVYFTTNFACSLGDLLLRYPFQGMPRRCAVAIFSFDPIYSTLIQDLAVTLGNYPNVVSLHLETEVSRQSHE